MRAIMAPFLGVSHQTSVRERPTGYGPSYPHHPWWLPRAIRRCPSVRLQAPRDGEVWAAAEERWGTHARTHTHTLTHTHTHTHTHRERERETHTHTHTDTHSQRTDSTEQGNTLPWFGLKWGCSDSSFSTLFIDWESGFFPSLLLLNSCLVSELVTGGGECVSDGSCPSCWLLLVFSTCVSSMIPTEGGDFFDFSVFLYSTWSVQQNKYGEVWRSMEK